MYPSSDSKGIKIHINQERKELTRDERIEEERVLYERLQQVLETENGYQVKDANLKRLYFI